MKWALEQKERLLFLPDQHLGRNTAFNLGIKLEEMAVWNPDTNKLETDVEIETIKVILGKAIVQSMKISQWKILSEVRTQYPANENHRSSRMSS